MNAYTVYVITAPINAFIVCAFVSFFIKGLHFKTPVRVAVTYFIYLLISFIFSAGGNGLLNIDMDNFNALKFALQAASGLCVSIFLYFYYERGNISDKIREKQAADKNKKKK